MILVTASLSALSLTCSAGYRTLGFGTTVADAATQSSALSSNACSLLMTVGFYVLCIKVIVSLALFFRSYAPRLSVSSINRFRWLFGTAFLLPVFSGSAFVFYPCARDAFHSLTSNVPAVVSKLWSFIQQEIAEPAPIRCFFDKLGNFTQLLNSAKEVLYALFGSLEIIVSLHPSNLICCG